MDHLTEFLRTPRDIGTVAPSSQALATAMVEWVDWDRVDVAVEYGPGTGVFTSEILSHVRSDAVFFAVEANATFATAFRKSFPGVKLYEDSVGNIGRISSQQGVSKIDCVVSGLPWATFSGTQQDRYLDEMVAMMPDGSQFATFAYLHGLPLISGRRFRARLDSHFANVETSETVWKNFPPAIVYRCRR